MKGAENIFMRSTDIRKVKAREILDCKGKPAIEVDVYTEGGAVGRAASPSGISAGSREAFVFRDCDPGRYDGMGVLRAVELVKKEIEPAVTGMDVFDQEGIDRKLIQLDGTENKSRLGGNTIYSVSLACIKAAAASLNMPLYQYVAGGPLKTVPIPTFNCIDGGSYQKGTMPFQECTVIPYRAKSIREAVEIGWSVFKETGKVIEEYQNGTPAKAGTVSGWQPPSSDPEVCFDILHEAAKRCRADEKIAFAADCASSEFYIEERDTYDFLGREMDLDEMLGMIKGLTEKYPFLYVEDPVQENDWAGWIKAAEVLNRTVVIGDDLTVTDRRTIEKAHELGACGGFIFKPNQVGTVTECLEAEKYARENNMLVVPSIRAGGSVCDEVIDIGVGIGAAATKQGPPKNGERIYGINFLLRAEDENPGAKPYDFAAFVRF